MRGREWMVGLGGKTKPAILDKHRHKGNMEVTDDCMSHSHNHKMSDQGEGEVGGRGENEWQQKHRKIESEEDYER